MGRPQKEKESDPLPPMRPALTPEAREKQLIALAYDLVEERLLNGTASASETTAILKLGTQREKLERDKLQAEVELTKAKSEAVESAKRFEEMMKEAMAAFKDYSGAGDSDEEDIF